MPAISFSGTICAVSASVPSTYDAAGFGALTYTTIGNVISWASVGDDHPDISVPLLSRTLHVSGPPDGGSRAFSYQYEISDPGQIILRANNGSNSDLSFKLTFPNGKIKYYAGRIANLKQSEVNNNSFIGEDGEVRVNSATITV